MHDMESHQFTVDRWITFIENWNPNFAWVLNVNCHVKLLLASPHHLIDSINHGSDKNISRLVGFSGLWYIPWFFSTHASVGFDSECSKGVDAHIGPILIVALDLDINNIVDFMTADYVDSSDTGLNIDLFWDEVEIGSFWELEEHHVVVQEPFLIEGDSHSVIRFEIECDAASFFSNLVPHIFHPWVLILNESFNYAVISSDFPDWDDLWCRGT
jgi:hypothetical protein